MTEPLIPISLNGSNMGGGNSGNAHKPRFVVGRIGQPVAVAVTQLAAQKEPVGKIAQLVREIESDPQFIFGYSIVQALVQSAKVAIEIDGGPNATVKDDPRAKALADNLTKRWSEALPHACRAFAFGRAAFEQYFECYDAANNLRLLGPLDALEYDDTRMLVQNGEYAGCEVKHGDKAIDLAPAQSWWFALDPTPKLPMGKSRYSGTPWKVFQKRRQLEDNWSIFAGKNANGTAIIKAPSQYPNNAIGQKGEAGELDASGQPLNPLVDTAHQWNNLKAGGAMVVPSETGGDDGHALFDMKLEPGQSNPAGLESRQRMLDDEVLKALGIPPRAVEQSGPAGSYSLSQTHMEVLRALISGILSQMTASYQEQVVDPAVKLNFAGGVKLWVVYQDLDPVLTATVIDLIKTILASRQLSLLVSQGAVDIAKLLEIANLPAGADLAGALQRIRHIEEQSAVAMIQPGGGAGTPPTNGPQGVQMSLITDARQALEVEGHPDVFSQSQIAKDLAAKIRERLPELIATIGDDQTRGRL